MDPVGKDNSNRIPEGQRPVMSLEVNDLPQVETRVVITLRGEAAMRIQMLADSTGIHKNLVARDLLIVGMIEKGMLLRSYEHPSVEKRPRKPKI